MKIYTLYTNLKQTGKKLRQAQYIVQFSSLKLVYMKVQNISITAKKEKGKKKKGKRKKKYKG